LDEKMTHSTVFPVTEQLNKAFTEARKEDSGIRCLQVLINIEGEKIEAGSTMPLTASLENDWKSMSKFFVPKSPCYVLFRSDVQHLTGYGWILVMWVPDGSPVRARMLYASTRDTLKKELGRSFFDNEVHGSSAEDLGYDAFTSLQEKHRGDAPLTETERIAATESAMAVDVDGSTDVKIKFPLADAAQAALRAFSSSELDHVQLSLDITRETIELAGKTAKMDVPALAASLPNNVPRFTIFRYRHKFEGDSFEPVVLVYSCPSESKVKERMLYSTVKAVVSAYCEALGITLEKKFEVEGGDELDEEYFMERFHEPEREVVRKPQFSRPVPQSGRSTPSSRGRPMRGK